jgi:outer membrane lipoprotein-sorting protein
MKSILEDSDFDGPLVDYQAKGYKIESAGTDKFEGTDTINLKITKPNGDVYIYYLDAEFYIPIKIDTRRMVRGAEREYETVLGDYKQVSGWYLPFSIEISVKGNQNRQKTIYDSIEANVEIADKRFSMPMAPAR